MPPHFRFSHLCGHIGISPSFPAHSSLQFQAQEQGTATSADMTQVFVPSVCPFCSNHLSPTTPAVPQPPNQSLGTPPDLSIVPNGTGILCLLSCTPVHLPYSLIHSPFWRWLPLRICSTAVLISSDIVHITQPYATEFRYLAWIPKPVGNVRLIYEDEYPHSTVAGTQEEGQRRPTTKATTAWRQRVSRGEVGAEVQSRFAGLVSHLHAVVLSGERAGRYG